MTTNIEKRLEREQRVHDALKHSARYHTLPQLRREAEKQYGLSYEGALEYAYENMLQEEANAIRGGNRND